MTDQHSDYTGPSKPDTPENNLTAATAPVDTAKIQEALEKRADQETSVLPHLSAPRLAAGHPARERWWNPSVRSWFFTFMCMNMPVVGWFYLFHAAKQEKDPKRKEFARAYLFYKLVFLIAGLLVLLILLWIGLGLLDKLLAYMEML